MRWRWIKHEIQLLKDPKNSTPSGRRAGITSGSSGVSSLFLSLALGACLLDKGQLPRSPSDNVRQFAVLARLSNFQIQPFTALESRIDSGTKMFRL